MPNSATKNMHYVILRDDDTCALTPVECLEALYRPFLDRGLPVNLATIPNVCTEAHRPNGQREGFLQFNHGTTTPFLPIGLRTASTITAAESLGGMDESYPGEA